MKRLSYLASMRGSELNTKWHMVQWVKDKVLLLYIYRNKSLLLEWIVVCGELAHTENQQFSSNMFPFLFCLVLCPLCLLNIWGEIIFSMVVGCWWWWRKKDNEWNEECIFIVELKLVGISIGSWKQQHNPYIYTFYVLCSCWFLYCLFAVLLRSMIVVPFFSLLLFVRYFVNRGGGWMSLKLWKPYRF